MFSKEYIVILCVGILPVVSTTSTWRHVSNGDTNPDPDCPTLSSCSCSGFEVDCSDLNLTSMPPFFSPSEKTKHYTWRINLENNQISHIPSKAFENLTIHGLMISHNNMTTMADDAFFGTEQTLSEVFMQYNMFREIPAAIGSLRKLDMLSIHHNPIASLREDVLRNLSSTLDFFDVGSVDMVTWPTSIRALKALGSLTLYDLPMSDLPLDAFEGLDSLYMLEFQTTRLEKIPDGLKKLTSLTDIMFTDNVYLTNEGFSNDSFTGMVKLSDFYIDNSSLTEIPNFSSLQNLRSLSVTNANISKWDKASLPPKPAITSAFLDHTSFTNIPAVISTIPTLASISLMYTNIANITSDDFKGLQNLAVLSLGYSPIRNISDDAFDSNPAITHLYLNNEILTEFPKAIRNLRDVKDIILIGNRIFCSCESMGWLKNWHHSTDFWIVAGYCTNVQGVPIQEYINTYIPKCK